MRRSVLCAHEAGLRVKVLVVGSGGREHALAWHLASHGAEVIVAPGNAGTSKHNAPLQVDDTDGLVELARRERVELTIVGPEAPLATGLVDRFAAAGLAAFGPTQAAARLEWSKAWTKDFLHRYAIPTARAQIVESPATVRQAIARTGLPVVLKADGLASGKGVFVVNTQAEVEPAVEQLFGHLGQAASSVLVEERLAGRELSVLAFCDGQTFVVMPPARDYKRLLDADRGPNTGGMGGYTRPGDVTSDLLREVEAIVLRPALDGMQREGHPFRGVLYAGLMLTAEGPKVLEFNCRFGDPECQLILPLLESDLAELCAAAVTSRLEEVHVRWRDERTFGVVLAARGYPEAPETGDPIEDLEAPGAGVLAFHAGTRITDDGRLVTAGGRVVTLVGFDRDQVYRAAETVRFAGKQFRRDVGLEVPSSTGARQ